ncbi:hypothetical protein, partial [Runella sp.]|uniref:hypothetical protein n=1 Tax=Runella sp. TaxID=1960881 RepID=UPI00262B1F43
AGQKVAILFQIGQVAQLGDWLVLLAIQLGEAALHLIHRRNFEENRFNVIKDFNFPNQSI